jgi:hypothetical protein
MLARPAARQGFAAGAARRAPRLADACPRRPLTGYCGSVENGDGSGLPIAWADAHFDGIDVDYERVRLRLTDHRGVPVEVIGDGWIALSVGFFRDDSYVEDGRLITDDPRIDEAVAAVSERPGASGSPARESGAFALLEVDLDDGAKFECIAAAFRVTFQHAD